jgi:hypothetical protein
VILDNGPYTAGRVFHVTVMVKGYEPETVTIDDSSLKDSFAVTLKRSFARVIKDDEFNSTRWAAFEWTLEPLRPGKAQVGPFRIDTPQGTASTLSRVITAAAAPDAGAVPVFSWEPPAPAAKVGGTVVVVLHAQGGSVRLPPDGLYYAPPREALVEVLPLSPEEQAGGVILKLGITPLAVPKGGSFSFAEKKPEINGRTASIPAFTVHVTN